MVRTFTAFLFRTAGWKIIGRYPTEVKKAVWVGTPHFSNWDFVVCLGGRAVLQIDIGFLAKSQLFTWYAGWLFRAMGCYPVQRNKSSNLVDTVVEMYNNHNSLHIAITPEGTRNDVDRLKTGFYHIALKANVPLILIGFDYPRKAVVVSEPIYLKNDYQADMKVIYDFYLTIGGKRKTWIKNYQETGVITQP